MLERSSGSVPREEVASHTPGERVGAIGVTDRGMPVYHARREPVLYGRGTLWIVIGLLAVLFAVFFGFILFFR